MGSVQFKLLCTQSYGELFLSNISERRKSNNRNRFVNRILERGTAKYQSGVLQA
jgi:hypothetical protein